MLRSETLFLINFLEMCSTPISRSWMHISKFSIWLGNFSLDWGLWLARDYNAASTFSNSFLSDSWESQTTLLECINLDIADHPLCFECPFGSEINGNKLSNEHSVTVSASFKNPSIGEELLSLMFVEDAINSFFIVFKFTNAFRIFFFLFFLKVMYFTPSFVNPVSIPLFLLMIDFKSYKLSFDSERKPLAVLHISNILRDLSSRSSTLFSLHSCDKACCSIDSWSTSLMQPCKSCTLLSLLHIEDDDTEDAPSELFNLYKLSSNCDTRWCDVDVKLLLRRCRELFVFVSMTAIFLFLENRRLEGVNIQEFVSKLEIWLAFSLHIYIANKTTNERRQEEYLCSSNVT